MNLANEICCTIRKKRLRWTFGIFIAACFQSCFRWIDVCVGFDSVLLTVRRTKRNGYDNAACVQVFIAVSCLQSAAFIAASSIHETNTI